MPRRERKPMRAGGAGHPVPGEKAPWAGKGGSESGARYLEACRRRAVTVKSRREFGQLTIETLAAVACEHRLTTMRLGAIKSLEAGDTKRHLAALRKIERCETAPPSVRTAAHQAGNVVQARIEAR